MSTRAQVRFATREEGVSFSEHPKVINAQFYVHHDGYPEGLGLEIAESLTKYKKIMHWEIEELFTKHGDLEYIYCRSPRFVSRYSISHPNSFSLSNIDSAISIPNPSGYPSLCT